jgi:hypothetical protein
MKRSAARQLTGGRFRWWALVAIALACGFGFVRTAWSAGAADSSHVIELQDDGRLLTPANPLALGGHTIRYLPLSAGGYRTEIVPGPSAALALPPAAMKRLTFGDGSTRVAFSHDFPFFGSDYGEAFVHPAGTISFGEALPADSEPHAAASGDLLRSLTAGPPVVAALWNELLPNAAGGVFAAELDDRVVIAWRDVPSTRPAAMPNSFRVGLFSDGRIEVSYDSMATAWGIAGLSPGRTRDRTAMVDLATAPTIGPRDAALAWYHDLPTLNETEVSRATLEHFPDRFEFLAVFTTFPVDGQNLISSTTVKNTDQGIGLPLFDHGVAFGSRTLEHIALLNDLGFYDDDPTRPPRLGAYAYAPSTLAVVAHEIGHRWLANAQLVGTSLAGRDGHWSFGFDSGASLLGGNALRDNGDGSFTTTGALAGFGPLDEYLMGLRAPEEVGPLFVVNGAHDFDPPRSASGKPFDTTSHPQVGVTFRGEAQAFSVGDVEARLGPRLPDAANAPRSFRTAFVLVSPRGVSPTDAQAEKIDRIRREFGPYFRQVSGNRARMKTWLPIATAAPTPTPASASEPRILDAAARRLANGRAGVVIDYASAEGALGTVEVSTDGPTPTPTTVDVTAGAFGRRTGSLSLVLRDVPAAAGAVYLELVDGRGRRSGVRAVPLTAAP